MIRAILLSLALVISLSLTACVQARLSRDKEPTVTLSSVDDPDGDNDNKGVNYFAKVRVATGKKIFIFDPNFDAWAVYNEMGERVNTGRASGGKFYCPDVQRDCKTISGKFRILTKGSEECISNKYPVETEGGAPMPYCMYFDWQGYAIHGSYDVPDGNASHGCIRVTPLAAKWINQNFLDVGSTVIVLPYEGTK